MTRPAGSFRNGSIRLLPVFVVLVAAAGVLGSPVAAEDEAWERGVKRAREKQNREIKSAKTRRGGMEIVVRRYRQQVRNDDSPLNNYLLGRAHWESAQHRIQVLRNARKGPPTEADRKAFEAEVGEARKRLERAIELDPKFHFAVLGLVKLAMLANKRDEAKTQLTNFRRLKPKDPEGIRLHARLLMAEGRMQGVAAAMRGLLARDPADHEAREILVAVLADAQKWEEALEHVEALVRAMPDDEGLRLLLIDCLTGLSRWERAQTELEKLMRVLGDQPPLLRKLAEIHAGKGDWDAVTRTLQTLLRAHPDDWRLRRLLMDAHLGKGDWAGVLAEEARIRKLLSKEDWEKVAGPILWNRAVAQFNLQRFEEALAASREVLLGTGDNLRVLDMAQRCLAHLRRHRERVPLLERMLKLELDGQARQKIREVIEALNAGAEAPPGPNPWQRDDLVALLEACIHPDPQVRRRALHQYFELDVPFVDPVIYRRYDPDVEKDMECRIWVVRILGKFRADVAELDMVRDVARYVGLALEDPTAQVRTVAAEELGLIKTPAGVLYLMPHLSAIELTSLPTEEAARTLLEREYNASRLAMAALAGREDTPIGAPTWIPLEDAAKNRAAWTAWLDSADGVKARLASLEDLAATDIGRPRWQLRYALQDLVRKSPDAVAARTYRVLRDAILKIGPERIRADAWWRTFPIYDDAQLAPAGSVGLDEVRAKVSAWWKGLDRKPAAPANGGGAPVRKNPGSKPSPPKPGK